MLIDKIQRLAINSVPMKKKDFYNTRLLYTTAMSSPIEKTIDALSGSKYQGDLFGYLRSINLPDFSFYVIMDMNGFNNTTDFGPHVEKIKIPNSTALDTILKQRNTSPA